jgi:CubicO group peptidase (beta-lactamase class C family)
MCAVVGTTSHQAAVSGNELDEFIEAEMQAQRIPGLAACIVKSGKIVWSRGYGWACVKRRVAMDPDRTIQNIGSISKTVTATAAMQLWEKGRFELDDDVNDYLPFAVRNPSHPDKPISFRCLLTHRSSIADGPAYMSSYACGDPRVTLDAWIRGYLSPDGRYYRRGANFHPWRPGKKHRYSNVGFGLLGYLIERVSGESFTGFTKRHIFEPLGMKATGWMLSEIARERHAVPYVPIHEGQVNKVLQPYKRMGILGGEVERDPGRGSYQPVCLYSFPNYPDGSLRTGVNQLARFLLAYVNQGVHGGGRILEADTVRLMLTRQNATMPHQGLCWATQPHDGGRRWFHDGADPGIRTSMSFRPSDGVGVVVFINRTDVELKRLNDRLFRESARF